MAQKELHVGLPFRSELTVDELKVAVEDGLVDLDFVLSDEEGDPVDLCTIMGMNEFMQGRS